MPPESSEVKMPAGDTCSPVATAASLEPLLLDVIENQVRLGAVVWVHEPPESAEVKMPPPMLKLPPLQEVTAARWEPSLLM